jgi:hypothetical protein
MRQRLRPHLTYANVMSTLAVFLILGGGAYAATGGNFILGQSNSAGSPTRLSSPTTDSAGALRVSNTSNTAGGKAISAVSAGTAVWADTGDASVNKAAIHGQSTIANAAEGISSQGTGVYGQNNGTGFGVAGRSANGTGVMGDSTNGWAMQAFGNAWQTRGQSGFVKAMAYVVPFQADPIPRCFNSQLPPGQATSGDCGITFTFVDTGRYVLHFNFKVDDRFLSSSMGCSICTAGVVSTGPNDVSVAIRTTGLQDFINEDFSILVY